MRVQRRRDRGWRMPPNTVYVGRIPRTITLFGNPFLGDRAAAVTAYFAYLGSPNHFDIMIGDGNGLTGLAFVPDCNHASRVLRALPNLRGKNLALVEPFIMGQHGEQRARRVDMPIPTVTTVSRIGLVQPHPDETDILFRMIRNHELAAAMSLTDGQRRYEFVGNQAEVTRQIGNACPRRTIKALVGSLMR